MAAAWKQNVAHIQDGEPVNASVAGRPDRTLETRDQYLKDRLDAAALGEGTIAHGVICAADVLVNQPVAFNPASGLYERALAGVELDVASSSLVASDLSRVTGIVLAKDSATSARVLTAGRAPTDLANAVDGTPEPGTYYLSAAAAGKLTRQRPAVSVPVLQWDGVYAYVRPEPHDFLESHVHYRVELACKPAGTNTLAGGRHTVTAPDPALPGWLPAGHVSFGGTAPTGAAFGYNLVAHPELKALWPPVPVGSVAFWIDRGLALDQGGHLVPQGLNGLVHADGNGIWWMSDCQGDVPWPEAYVDATNPPPVAANAATPECPRLDDMRLTASFTHMLFATDKSVVTSLGPEDPDGPLQVVDCDGEVASAGDLKLRLDLDFLVDSAVNTAGYVVFKELDGVTFKRGPVVERIVAGANISLASTDNDGRGTVSINADTNLADRELTPQIVRLAGALERTTGDIMFLGFPAGKLSSIRMRFNVPAAGLPDPPQLKIRLLVYGTSGGRLPDTTMSYRRLPRPNPPTPATRVTPPAADTPLACDTNHDIGAGQYIEVESAPIGDIEAGDTLLVTFTRNPSDGYTGEVGLIRQAGILVAG